jgi:hypothetical protein
MRGAVVAGVVGVVAMLTAVLWYASSTGVVGITAINQTFDVQAPAEFTRATLFGAVKDTVASLPEGQGKRELQIKRPNPDAMSVILVENGVPLMAVSPGLNEAPKNAGTIVTYRLTQDELALAAMFEADQKRNGGQLLFSPAGVADQMGRLGTQLAFSTDLAFKGATEGRRENLERNPQWGQAAILYVEAMRNLAGGERRAAAR